MTTATLRRPDDIYASLIALHDGKSEEDSLKLWAKLSLLLIGEIGDDEIVLRLIDEAGRGTTPSR